MSPLGLPLWDAPRYVWWAAPGDHVHSRRPDGAERCHRAADARYCVAFDAQAPGFLATGLTLESVQAAIEGLHAGGPGAVVPIILPDPDRSEVTYEPVVPYPGTPTTDRIREAAAR